MLIKIDKIIPDPNQPRKTFKEAMLGELRESLDSLGMINPITVRNIGDGKYMIIVGERRYRAAKKAGLNEVDCIIRDDVDDKQAREMQFAENRHFEEVQPLEIGRAINDYLNKYGESQHALAKKTGIAKHTISELVSLVTRLEVGVAHSLAEEKITFTEAREIASIEDKEKQKEVAKPFIRGEVSSRHAPSIVAKVREEPKRPVDDVVDEVVYGVKHVPKEELELAKPPETMLDIGFKLEEKALDLSQTLTAYDLSRIPAGQRLALTSALKILADKIELALEFLTGKKRREIEGIIEGEAKQIEN